MRLILALLVVFLACASGPAVAQDRRPSHCIALAQDLPDGIFVHRAAYRDPLPDNSVRLRYVAHATFLIRTPGGLNLATDYTGFLGTGDLVPDVVTMNRAHDTHWTPVPDPRIPHVLPGWNPEGGPVNHHLDLGEVLVRSVSTDIRSWSGGVADGRDGNAIFVFEVAGLCIGHLGHLHHEPTPEQYAALGRLDVVMAPVDGGMTLDLPTMIRVLQRLRASVVVPMHWFGTGTLDRFLAGMSQDFRIERTGASETVLSLRSLPPRPTVLVLSPAFLRDDD
ncbi:MAG: MBL fold metallo-hydrolase [Rhodobacteraceae bacterium]|nr:MBL fold metallo-hydrolase [Paracoccaceae bacterium]